MSTTEEKKKDTLFNQEMRYLRERACMINEARKWCSVVDEMEEKFPDIFISGSVVGCAQVSVNPSDITQIAPVLKFLAKDYNLKHSGAIELSSELMWEFRLRHPIILDGNPVVLRLIALFLGDGKCRRVQVGTETIPKYALRCGDSEENISTLVAGMDVDTTL